MAVVKVSSKNAVQLSTEVRRQTGIKPGDELVQVAQGGEVVMYRVSKDPLADLLGAISIPPDFDVAAWLAEERAAWGS